MKFRLPCSIYKIIICQYHIINGDYEIAVNEAVSLNMKAEKVGDKMNLVYTNSNIGLIYLFINRYQEAIPFFEKSLLLMREIKDFNKSFELSIMSYLIYVSLHANNLDKMKRALDHYKSKLETDSTLSKSKSSTLYSNYVNYYVAKNEVDSAEIAVQKANSFIDKDYGRGYTSVYYLAMARYYHFIADYEKGLSFVNKALEVDYCLEVLEVKMSLLENAGKIDEALRVCGEAVKLITDQSTATYSRQMDRLQILHKLNDQTRQSQQLLDQKNEIVQKQRLLLAFFNFCMCFDYNPDWCDSLFT